MHIVVESCGLGCSARPTTAGEEHLGPKWVIRVAARMDETWVDIVGICERKEGSCELCSGSIHVSVIWEQPSSTGSDSSGSSSRGGGGDSSSGCCYSCCCTSRV